MAVDKDIIAPVDGLGINIRVGKRVAVNKPPLVRDGIATTGDHRAVPHALPGHKVGTFCKTKAVFSTA